MWRFKQKKEQTGLEGRTIDVGNVKVHVRETIAEGGFSCVYSAVDLVNSAKQYALKHVVIQDKESLDLVTKEIAVMKSLKGHPNVVTLVAHAILDMGRTKEALLVMEFCEKSLVSVLEGRGAGYFNEQQVVLIFRDVCNAVFAMHCQSPPIAHRDLKAENILLRADGAWKLCDFGSISTNHKCFDKPEEMGIEEDNIRKYTTPAYRAPEMWDLYRKEVISEKVDIWALGCLLFRICYFKLAFDGESKLQILNGNYHIPDLPKYSSNLTNLIKDMLQASPDARPDITQIWFRVNELLPLELQKDLPDGSPSGSPFDMHPPKAIVQDEVPKKAPQRSPPPPPSRDTNIRSSSPQEVHNSNMQGISKAGESKGSLGAFWSTQLAQDLSAIDDKDKGPVFDQEPMHQATSRHPNVKEPNTAVHGTTNRNSLGMSSQSSPGDFEIRFSPNGSEYGPEKTKQINPETKSSVQNTAFDSFVTDFDTAKVSSKNNANHVNMTNRMKEQELEAEVNLLREELKAAKLEKEEMTSKYHKLSTICSSQREEIQQLKQGLAAICTTPLNKEPKDSLKADISPASSLFDTPPREKIEGTPPELKQGLFTASPGTPSPDSKAWAAFAEESKAQPAAKGAHPRSVRTVRAGSMNKTSTLGQANTNAAKESWQFDQESFNASFPPGTEGSKTSILGNTSHHVDPAGDETKRDGAYRPGGWTGF